MAQESITTIINQVISPYSLNRKGEAKVTLLENQYSYDLLIECIKISACTYLQYDENDNPLQDSICVFLDKIGGIAHNKSLPPIEKEIRHLTNMGNKQIEYWNCVKANSLLHTYIDALRSYWYYTDEQILEDLQGQTSRMLRSTNSWYRWEWNMINWINEIKEETNK